jgi:hypothetical protein
LLLAAVWRDPALNKKKSILVTASSRSATLTEFYRRAVMFKPQAVTSLRALDNIGLNITFKIEC